MRTYAKDIIQMAMSGIVVFVVTLCATETPERPIGPSWNALYSYTKPNYSPQLPGNTCPGRDVMVCIMPDNFAPAFQTYAEWKHKSGTFIKIVKFSEIGASSATASCSTAIKPFVQNAYDTWKYRPSHVLLVGDAGVFPHKKWASATENTYMANNTTDAYFGEVDSSNYHEPDIMVGRLCVKDTAEMVNLLKKIMNYERKPPTTNTDWFKRIVAISSNQTEGAAGTVKPTLQVETVREVSLMQMESGYTVDTLMCSENSDVDLSSVISSINKGCSFINYRGQGWAQGWLTPCYQFYVDNVSRVQNSGMLPFITGIGCGITMFDVSPGGLAGGTTECFGEEIMRLGTPTAPRGAIAVLAPPGETHSYWNNAMDKGLYIGMFQHKLWSTGHALIAGIDAMYKSDLNRDTSDYLARLYLLLGDPSTRVWKEVPQTAILTGPSSIPRGVSNQTFSVKIGTQPVKNALVCISGGLTDSITYACGSTDPNGSVILSVNAATDGMVSLTACGENIIPVEQQLIVEGTGTVQKFANGLAVFTLTAGFKNSEKSTVIISYSVPKNGRTTLAIYSLQGTLVRTIISGMQPAGFHTIAWNSRDEKGSIAARGMYIVSLKQDKNFIWQRIIKTE